MNRELRLYFLRHGHADRGEFGGTDDSQRPLTPEGAVRMRREADFMVRLGVEPDVILTSPLVRARQTAEIVGRRLGLHDRVAVDQRLDLWFDTGKLAAILADHSSDHREIMLVGHEPSFSEVVGAITGGSAVVCKKGGLARVDLLAGQTPLGRLVWLLPPKAMLG